MPKISVVIPVRNRKHYTYQVLSQIEGQIIETNSRQFISIIVVDDGSTDGTRELIKLKFPDVHLLEADGSLWWAGCMVKGMEYAQSILDTDYVIWLNDDLYLSENFLPNLIDLCSDPTYSATLVGGIVRDRTYPDWIVYSGTKGRKPISHLSYFQDGEELEVDVLCGNMVIIPQSVIQKIGLPNAKKLPHHGSDYEYIRKAKKAQFKVILSTKLQAETDFQVTDFIRYMPYWIQWSLQPNLSQRWEIVKGLTSLKSNQNIWQIVGTHSSNHDLENIPPWRYVFGYFNKLLRLLLINWMPEEKLKKRIEEYLDLQNPPIQVREAVLNKNNPNHPEKFAK